MLILASISGIQDFLFAVRDEGGKQARSLRLRSFRIQLLAEAVALRLLDAAGLSHERLIFCAAAKVCIDGGGCGGEERGRSGLSSEAAARVRGAAVDVGRRLLVDTHGRLRLSVELSESTGNFAATFECAGRLLARRKLQPLRSLAEPGGAWADASLVVSPPWDQVAESGRDADIGGQLTQAKYVCLRRSGDSSRPESVGLVGLSASLDRGAPGLTSDLISVSNLDQPDERPDGIPPNLFHVRRLARHVPRDAHGDLIEFVDLAAHSRGAAMLGVLKADADSLGQAISHTLKERTDPQHALRNFSGALDRFFAETLQTEMQHEPWNLIYTVFSGGDDLLVVGPWDAVLDFAGHMRTLFETAFGASAPASKRACPHALTISAGVAIIKPKYPIHLAAAQADELLDCAKSEPARGTASPKDQCATLGQVWKWADHHRILDNGKQLADWVDAGIVQRGWLHTLLELALLRRGEAGPEYDGVHPAVATSRLAYHVARIWPKWRESPRNDRERAENAAREWVDGVLDDFDIENPADQRGRTRYLPVIVRYALLATRSGSSEDK